jgi:cell division protein FtsL
MTSRSTSASNLLTKIQASSQRLAILLTITAFISGFGYVMLTNTTASEGLAIRKLQVQITDLKSDNEKLQLTAADMRSLSIADAASEQLELQPVDTFQVVPADGGSVARR